MKTKIILIAMLLVSVVSISQTTAIPDPNFEQALIDLGIDSDGLINGQVLTSDINIITNLDVSNKNIADLTGIEDFIALTDLWCQNNQLTNLTVSQNTNLEVLLISNNQLTNLDISQNLLLNILICQNNQLVGLDVSQNLALTNLECQSNQLINLDVTQNSNLTHLWCNSNQLTSLDVSQNTVLAHLTCQNNLLIGLDIRNGNNSAIPSSQFYATEILI
jgi:hypothetical protein